MMNNEIITNVLGEKKLNKEFEIVEKYIKKTAENKQNTLNLKLEDLNSLEIIIYEKVREFKSVKKAMDELNIKRNIFIDNLESIYKKLNIFGRLDLIARRVNTRSHNIKSR